MTGDAEATKQRILQAAIEEFAARGLAGARIDRIAESASANKQLIYAYFGSKQQLFDAAITNQIERFHEDVPFDPTRLPDLAVAAYDFFAAHPELARLSAWHALEEGQEDHPIPEVAELWRKRVRAISRAQQEGLLNRAIPAADLLLFIFAVARAYVVTIPEVSHVARGGNARRRKAVYEAVQRLVD
jgi:AcrR family transcriptional regulator